MWLITANQSCSSFELVSANGNHDLKTRIKDSPGAFADEQSVFLSAQQAG